MKIDSGVHFWKYEKTIGNPVIRNNKLLQQNYLPEQIKQTLHRNGIAGCLAVVAESEEVETRFLSELALTHPEIRGVIGWLDLSESGAVAKIQEFQQYSPVRGYRVDLSNNHLPVRDTMDILKAQSYSLDISMNLTSGSAGLNKWLAEYPEQSFILENCGNPDARQSPSETWKTAIRELSKYQNLNCKVSGLFERSNSKSWRPADFYPFLDILFESFGSGRLLFASDWPFLLLSGMYLQWKSLLEKYTEKFSEDERDRFFGENARTIYRL
jgi:L-fuconolactonase